MKCLLLWWCRLSAYLCVRHVLGIRKAGVQHAQPWDLFWIKLAVGDPVRQCFRPAHGTGASTLSGHLSATAHHAEVPPALAIASGPTSASAVSSQLPERSPAICDVNLAATIHNNGLCVLHKHPVGELEHTGSLGAAHMYAACTGSNLHAQ